jgi:FkbM family methyltransferase
VEPARIWHKDLFKNRTSKIDTNCVSGKSGQVVSFNEVSSPELSTINEYSKSDLHSDAREKGVYYDVSTISLIDLLDKYQAPAEIDYLSIDTEGSEFDILNNFDFSKYKFNVITCEHNYTPAREKIYDLLMRNGYQRKYEEFSDFDDWYIRVR